MKPFRIKKRSHRQAYFISGESVTSFPKPKFSLRYFKKIHPPALFKRERLLPVVEQAMTQEGEERFVTAAGQVAEYLRLATASEN